MIKWYTIWSRPYRYNFNNHILLISVENIELYYLFNTMFSLSSRGWSTSCVRGRGGSQTCSVPWFASVKCRRKRRRRAGLCPAFLIGFWRPCKPDKLHLVTAKRNSQMHTHTSCLLPDPVSTLAYAPPAASWKHNAEQHTWEFHTTHSFHGFFFFFFFSVCLQLWMDQSPFTIGNRRVGGSSGEWSVLQEIIVGRF